MGMVGGEGQVRQCLEGLRPGGAVTQTPLRGAMAVCAHSRLSLSHPETCSVQPDAVMLSPLPNSHRDHELPNTVVWGTTSTNTLNCAKS